MKQPSPNKCEKLAAVISAYIEKAEDDELLEQLRDEGFVDPEGTLQTVRRVEKAVRGIYSQTTRFVLDSLKKAVNLAVWAELEFPGVMLDDDMAHKVARVFVKEFSESIPKYVSLFHAELGHSRAVASMTLRTTHYVDKWAQTLGGLMKLQEYDTLHGMIDRALVRGAGVEELTREIYTAGIRDRPWKARRVALTEMLRAQSFAQNEAIMTSPSVDRKKWRHTGEHKITPRENHVAINGQTVPKDQPFKLLGADGRMYYPMFPRDPLLPAKESVNCHCIVEPVTSDAVTGLSNEQWDRLAEEARRKLREDKSWEEELNEKYKAASQAYHAEKNRNRQAMPSDLSPKRQKWFNRIDGTTTENGVVAHTTRHLFDRMEERGIYPKGVLDALQNPLEIKPLRGDGTRQYVGVRATVAVDQKSGNITTGWKTDPEDVKRYMEARLK